MDSDNLVAMLIAHLTVPAFSLVANAGITHLENTQVQVDQHLSTINIFVCILSYSCSQQQ